ncbi:MAG: sulfate adenylyltransferase subunit CysD [Candidatus Omnitrophota bacterium]
MSDLDELENQSIFIIREAYWRYRAKLAVLWSCGKDSTTMLYLIRKAFLGDIPLSVIHIDTSFKFKEIYKFRDNLVKKWHLKLIVAKNELALREGMFPKKGRFECCNALKTEALKQTIKKYGFQALFLAIRRDEHAIRAKERFWSPRDKDFKWDYQNQPLEMWAEFSKAKEENEIHFRIHPLLSWREIDIWGYIKREKIPIINLYFAKKGKRYRSIGCEPCCEPVPSEANTIDKIIKELEETKIAERTGRAQDKEKAYMMQKLRALGYM